jgi:hypothetical protein
MTISFEIRIGDLLLKLFADADVFRNTLKAAGAITPVLCHDRTEFLHVNRVRIAFDVFRQFHFTTTFR